MPFHRLGNVVLPGEAISQLLVLNAVVIRLAAPYRSLLNRGHPWSHFSVFNTLVKTLY
jgi:hypothetical protein